MADGGELKMQNRGRAALGPLELIQAEYSRALGGPTRGRGQGDTGDTGDPAGRKPTATEPACLYCTSVSPRSARGPRLTTRRRTKPTQQRVGARLTAVNSKTEVLRLRPVGEGEGDGDGDGEDKDDDCVLLRCC